MESSGEFRTDGGGRLLAGRYRVSEQLGRGGMGVVCRATDEVLGREVAVKELRTYADAAAPELADLRRRMQREARAAARVRHPGVIAVHDIAEHEGRPVIVMELVDGPSLDDVLRDRGTLAPVEAAAIGAKVVDALAAAHRVGVLHRDVKPGNILLEHGGRVVLTDFGIAAVEEGEEAGATRLTGSGELVGSLDYLAPERARGEQPGPASDIWSLGATLYAAVEGASPFRRTSTWSTLTAIVVEPMPPPRNAGPVLTPVLAELMDKDPGARADAARAVSLLAAVADGTVPPPPEPGHGTMRLGAAGGTGGTGGAGGPAAAAPYSPTSLEAGGVAAGGFGPPPAVGEGQYPQDQRHPQQPGEGPGERETDRQTMRTRSAAARSRRRRAVVAAAVAAVLLAGAGVTYAVVGAGDGKEPAAAASQQADDPSGAGKDDARGTGDKPEDRQSSPGASASPSGEGAAAAGGSDDDGPEEGQDGGSEEGTTGGGASSGGGESGSEGSSGGASGGGPGSGDTGGGEPEPEPGCHAIGGGKYNCQVWRTAASYNSAHEKVGTLHAGTNYFFCQQKKAHRETSGRWTNVWWARTDDDSGNARVYVSAVYIEGGANDAPVPGLPVC